jgi:hypothetical protein
VIVGIEDGLARSAQRKLVGLSTAATLASRADAAVMPDRAGTRRRGGLAQLLRAVDDATRHAETFLEAAALVLEELRVYLGWPVARLLLPTTAEPGWYVSTCSFAADEY